MIMLSGAYEGCIKAKITCYGTYRDWFNIAPDVVGGSAVVHWEPYIRWIIDEWYKAKASAQPFNGNTEKKWIPITAANTASLALGNYPHSADAKAKAEEVWKKIKSGEFEVPLNVEKPLTN